MEQALVIIIVLIGVGFWIKTIRKNEKESRARQLSAPRMEAIHHTKAYFADINTTHRIPEVSTDILLDPGEKAYLYDDHVSLLEMRAARKTETVGAGVRVLKGVYVGGASGTSRAYDELCEIGSGTLTLTNKRIIFNGASNPRNIPLQNIIAVNESSEIIEISLKNRIKSMYFTGVDNAILWKSLVQFIRALPPDGSIPHVDIEIQYWKDNVSL